MKKRTLIGAHGILKVVIACALLTAFTGCETLAEALQAMRENNTANQTQNAYRPNSITVIQTEPARVYPTNVSQNGYSSSSYGGSYSSSRSEDCSKCGGTGKCNFVTSAGNRVCSNGYIYGNNGTRRCPRCHGKGYCLKCGGTGKR